MSKSTEKKIEQYCAFQKCGKPIREGEGRFRVSDEQALCEDCGNDPEAKRMLPGGFLL